MVLAGAAGLVALGALLPRLARRARPAPAPAARLRRGAAVLSASVLADSATEHYRGSYHHRAMFAAPAMAGATLASLGPGTGGPGVRRATQRSAIATGLAGNLFHLRNAMRRPGAPSWETLFYAAPLGAPGALAMAGIGGLVASGLEQAPPGGETARRLGRRLALGTSAGLAATSAEAALLHFRGAFHAPAMWLPVTLPPVAALALAGAAWRPGERGIGRARGLLRATAAMGLLGMAFHARGVARNMGGWRNWSQNLQVAPPMPAPPAFAGVALGGLAALDLMEAP
ncbi:hypothetical protein DR046_09740 [Jannaschia formosa]|nr:hypothetical protein DR046_09740 [Jannaschia formosa]